MSAKSFGELLGALIKERRETGGLTQLSLAEEAFPDADDHDSKARRIRELESERISRPQAKNYMPICEVLNIDRKIIRELKSKAADAKQQSQSELSEITEDYGSAGAAISDASRLKEYELYLLASLFGASETDSLTPEELRRFLTLKAEEYRALKAEVDAIPEGMKRLANLKAAAQDAIVRVDLDEVEDLLTAVQTSELEEAARTAELRADNALLKGDVEKAFLLLTTAADSFAAVDPLEPARRRILTYCQTLYYHGLRYGGDGLARAEVLLRQVLSKELRTKDDWLWAAGQNAIAIFLQNQGTRTEGQSGADLLAEAVTAYRAALEVHTLDAHPVDWAMTHNNLGIALQNQSIRTAGQAGADLLAEAVTACRAALEVRTRDAHPVHWAGTQNNLGVALSNQGTRTEGQAGADLLAEAVTAYRAALEVTTRDAHPVQWAETQANIAIAEEARADHDSCDDPKPALQAALAAVEKTLTVFDPEHMSYDHAKATRLRDRILARLAEL